MFLKFLKNKKFTVILILVILIIVVYAGVKWYEERMFWVKNGMANPKFPFRQYSILELVRQGKVTDYVPELEEALESLPTRTAPQETLDKYIQALKNGDIEEALNCCVEKDLDVDNRIGEFGHGWKVRESDIEYLYGVKERGYLDDMIEDLEIIETEIIEELKKITMGSTGEWKVQCKYQCEWGNGICYLIFTKDYWGDWKLSDPYL